MRVLIIGDWDAGGGVQTVLRSLAGHLTPADVTYSVFFFNKGVQRSSWSDFCTHVYYNQDISLTELLLQERFDLVHLIDTACPPPYHADLWLKRARYRGAVLCNIHVCTPVLRANQFAHIFVACSEVARNAASKIIRQDIRVVENGIDTSLFYPRPVAKPTRSVLAWVGRAADVERKDIVGFFYLAARLREQYDFWIASSGDLPEVLHVHDWFGSSIHVEYNLEADQLAHFYSKVAVSGGAVVATSVSESFHLASLEAAACGCPAILPRADWSSHIVDDVSGLLYDREDGLSSINSCLEKLDDVVTRERIISGASELIQTRLNSRRMADEYYIAYRDAIQKAQEQQAAGVRLRWEGRIWASALRLRRRLRRSSN